MHRELEPYCPICGEENIYELFCADGEDVGCECCLSMDSSDELPTGMLCPVCGGLLGGDISYFVYYRKDEIVGCELCTKVVENIGELAWK